VSAPNNEMTSAKTLLASLTWTCLANDHESNSNPCSLSVLFNHSSTPHKAHRKKPHPTDEDYSFKLGSDQSLKSR
jgi:hypothetical protein